MSFIDLMGNTVWSEQDIVSKTEAMIRSEFPVQTELILNRKVVGQIGGMYQMTDSEKEELARYQVAVENARIAGVEARKDMELLNRVLHLEAVAARLKQPVIEQIIVDGVVINQEEIDADYAERATAQAILDAMEPDEKELYDLRNPVAMEFKLDLAEAATVDETILSRDTQEAPVTPESESNMDTQQVVG
jgi:hypothetical protein